MIGSKRPAMRFEPIWLCLSAKGLYGHGHCLMAHWVMPLSRFPKADPTNLPHPLAIRTGFALPQGKHTIPMGSPDASDANPSALPGAAQSSRLDGALGFAFTRHTMLNVMSTNGTVTEVLLEGTYKAHHSGHASTTWPVICSEHTQEFPRIERCVPGTFNVELDGEYRPPEDQRWRKSEKKRGAPIGRYIDGNHLSPTARIIKMNGRTCEAWIYRGGHPNTFLELISEANLSELLKLKHGDRVILTVEEMSEGTCGMPLPPPADAPNGLPTT